ncbi:MAG: hypothetical protein ABJN84_07895 [Flavobacteriaceae bacterium]
MEKDKKEEGKMPKKNDEKRLVSSKPTKEIVSSMKYTIQITE